MKSFVKALMQYTPYRIKRAGSGNRFDSIDELLPALRERGFRCSVIVDGGANVGSFSLQASRIFPRARIEMVEPQPACAAVLTAIAKDRGFGFHPKAIVGPGYQEALIGLTVSPSEVTTGAHISLEPAENIVQVSAATLDDMIAGTLAEDDRVFLKLDLQGYELEALSGGTRTLAKTEVVLTEVSFFAQAYEPTIFDVFRFLKDQRFCLYDIASVMPRLRDGRAKQGDLLFVKEESTLLADTRWA